MSFFTYTYPAKSVRFSTGVCQYSANNLLMAYFWEKKKLPLYAHTCTMHIDEHI